MIKSITYLVVLLTLASCSKSENLAIQSDHRIIGNWVAESNDRYLDESEYTFKSDGSFEGLYIDLVYYENNLVSKSKIPYAGTYFLSENGEWLTIMESGDNSDTYFLQFINDKRFLVKESENAQKVIAIYNKR